MTESQEPLSDLEAVRARMKVVWASGDFSILAARIVLASERLVDFADPVSGSRVLDVACGSGNATIAAARQGCRAVGVDIVPPLLERGRARAAAEGFAIDFVEGDAHALPFDDGEFDCVISVYGVMFVPDQEQAARELLRVTRPGGIIALASWTPEGFIGSLLRTVTAHAPPPPGVKPPLLWGDEEHLRELFGDGAAEMRSQVATHVFRQPSAEAFVEEFRDYYGPTVKAYEALGDGAGALEEDFLELVRSSNRLEGGGAVAVDADYLQTVITRA